MPGRGRSSWRLRQKFRFAFCVNDCVTISQRSAECSEHLAPRRTLNLEPDVAIGVVGMTEGRIPPAPHHLCDLRQAPLFKAGLFVTACKSRSFRSWQKPTRFRSRQKPTRYAELQHQCDFGSALFSEFGGVHLWNGIGSWKQIKEK
jgi:hypothetical protein